MVPEGKIHLCGRFDGHGERFFDGEIAHLSLFDSALTEQEVRVAAPVPEPCFAEFLYGCMMRMSVQVRTLYLFTAEKMPSPSVVSEPSSVQETASDGVE